MYYVHFQVFPFAACKLSFVLSMGNICSAPDCVIRPYFSVISHILGYVWFVVMATAVH